MAEILKKEPAITEHYGGFHSQRNPGKVYPVEFVVRTLLGTYPGPQARPHGLPGRQDSRPGFGDGRNMPLLHDIGFEVYGVEISEEICRLTRSRMERLGVQVRVETGTNSQIPFGDGVFDFILDCHACYYVGRARASWTICERSRGFCGLAGASFSLSTDTYILKDAVQMGNGHYRITQDPYGLRNGGVFRAFASKPEIVDELGVYFSDLALGLCENDFYGTYEKVWIGTGLRKS